ncbi:hypothetical protein DLR41_20075, partial [Salmonella enterica subsp. enterica serovar Panama]|nr:hypothetical protein [Salmonella enterica subsp. enterica serovar Panama]
LINNGYYDDDKRKDHTNPEQYKRKFTHGFAKKEGRRNMPLYNKNNNKDYMHESYFICRRCRSSQ